MKSFKDFGVKIETKAFTGEKKTIDKVLNTEIVVVDYKIEDSKIKAGTKCLHLQIEQGNTRHVVFTGSNNLMAQIQQVPKEEFPFKTTITKDNKIFQFN